MLLLISRVKELCVLFVLMLDWNILKLLFLWRKLLSSCFLVSLIRLLYHLICIILPLNILLIWDYSFFLQWFLYWLMCFRFWLNTIWNVLRVLLIIREVLHINIHCINLIILFWRYFLFLLFFLNGVYWGRILSVIEKWVVDSIKSFCRDSFVSMNLVLLIHRLILI